MSAVPGVSAKRKSPHESNPQSAASKKKTLRWNDPSLRRLRDAHVNMCVFIQHPGEGVAREVRNNLLPPF